MNLSHQLHNNFLSEFLMGALFNCEQGDLSNIRIEYSTMLKQNLKSDLEINTMLVCVICKFNDK
jgi:hypothetical protein